MEEWRSVIGWEGSYEVSDLGRVQSLDRHITVFRDGKPYVQFLRGKILKASPGDKGYPVVSLTAPGGIREYRDVHELVATHFIGPRPLGQEVCHRNNIRRDCRKVNLRWGTRSSNALDRHEHGTMNQAYGENHFFHKLTVEDVKWIRSNAHLYGRREMARMFDVHHKTILNVVNNVQWKHC